MKRLLNIISAVLFVAVLALALVSSSYDPRFRDVLFGYFSNHNSIFIILRSLTFFLLILGVTYLNRKNVTFLCIAYPVLLALMMGAVFTDYFRLHHLMYNFYYVVMVCATVCCACISLFISATAFLRDKDYWLFFRVFWIAFLLVYLFLLYIAFIRTPNSFNLTMNFRFGEGTLRYFKSVLLHFNDTYLLFICFGNILILMPVPFIIYAVFQKTNPIVNVIVAIVLPVLIESYQYIFKCGDVDIDDVFLNTFGYLIAYLILRCIISYKTKKIPAQAA